MKTTVLDETDRRIVNTLLANGRISFASLGAEVGLSPHGAADRVRRLRRANIITAFTAKVDLEAVGRGLQALIDVRLPAQVLPEDFERHVAQLHTVRELAFVTGRFDYQLRVACVDADDLDRTVRAIRQGASAAQTETRIVMRSTSFSHPLG